MSTTIAFNPLLLPHRRRLAPTRAFRRSDLDSALRDAWRGANAGFETLTFEARRAAERLDRRFSLSRRLDSACRAAAARAREVDQELGIGRQWRTFSVDFARNWPRYRKELKDFLETPLGKSLGVIFFVWFVLSGWWFNFIVISMWVLPLASPLLIGLGRRLANNFVIEFTALLESLLLRFVWATFFLVLSICFSHLAINMKEEDTGIRHIDCWSIFLEFIRNSRNNWRSYRTDKHIGMTSIVDNMTLVFAN